MFVGLNLENKKGLIHSDSYKYNQQQQQNVHNVITLLIRPKYHITIRPCRIASNNLQKANKEIKTP